MGATEDDASRRTARSDGPCFILRRVLRTDPTKIGSAPVADVLIYADSFRSADMRHAIPLGVPDPILYAEAGGAKHVFTHSMEAARLRALGLFDVHVSEEFGS